MPFYADHSSFRSRATKLHDRASHVKYNKNGKVYMVLRESQENFMPYVISFKFRVNLCPSSHKQGKINILDLNMFSFFTI